MFISLLTELVCFTNDVTINIWLRWSQDNAAYALPAYALQGPHLSFRIYRKVRSNSSDTNSRHYFATERMRSINFGSSGSSPDFGRRGVSLAQFWSIANTLRNSGSDSSTRPMFTKATACQ